MTETTTLTSPDLAELPKDFRASAGRLNARDLIRRAVTTFPEEIVMTTSFGAHSAVMLHLATREKPDIPVIWIDTGYLFAETYRFAEQLTERLQLNLKVFQPRLSPARMEALFGRLWESETRDQLDRYDDLRKVEPMKRALRELKAKAWLAGLRRTQTDHRNRLSRIHRVGDIYKILPILSWSSKRLHEYLEEHDLPYHPLFDQGYVSIGDWHASEPFSSKHRHERETRYRGIKQECGIHLDLTDEAAESLDSSEL